MKEPTEHQIALQKIDEKTLLCWWRKKTKEVETLNKKLRTAALICGGSADNHDEIVQQISNLIDVCGKFYNATTFLENVEKEIERRQGKYEYR